MKEEFLHYLWKYNLYFGKGMSDDNGNIIEVIHPGLYNRDSGPDFFNARIRIGDTEWAGNVEIHNRASHFELHGHHRDHAYDNVILHVVAENDRMVRNARGKEVLTVKIDYDSSLYDKYTQLVNNPFVIACQEEIRDIEKFQIRHWLESLAIERLMEKSGNIYRILTETGNDWEETFYRVISRYFGFRVNTIPFEMLARELPFKIIRKHADNRLQVEALLFGTSGLLDEGLFREAIHDDYYRNLIKEFRIMAAKYSINPIHGWLWKFHRLRPANFPTVRLSQLAGMLTVAGGLFSKVIKTESIYDLTGIFGAEATDYWDDHYVFGKKSRKMTKCTGDTASEIILINSVIPLIFVYGKFHDNEEISGRAISFLADIKPEANAIINEWKNAGINAGSAMDSQALLQLRNEYCRMRRCLDCRIGSLLISRGARLKSQEELILEPQQTRNYQSKL